MVHGADENSLDWGRKAIDLLLIQHGLDALVTRRYWGMIIYEMSNMELQVSGQPAVDKMMCVADGRWEATWEWMGRLASV